MSDPTPKVSVVRAAKRSAWSTSNTTQSGSTTSPSLNRGRTARSRERNKHLTINTMGMYTEVFVNVDLKKSVPKDVIATLKAMCGQGAAAALKGKPDRRKQLFSSGSYYTPNTCVGQLTFDAISMQWSLLGKGDIKNHESEIEAFFEWLDPHIAARKGVFIGYSRYEENALPTLRLKT